MITGSRQGERPDKGCRRLSRARVRRWVRETEKQLQAILTEAEWTEYQRSRQAAEARAKRTWDGRDEGVGEAV